MLSTLSAAGLVSLLCASVHTSTTDWPGEVQLSPVTTASAQDESREGATAPDRQLDPAQNEYAVKVAVDSVFLNVFVQERNTNRSLPGLKKEDFLVYEDGVLQQVEQFLPSEAPLNVLLLLDVSGSTGLFLSLMRGASIDFIRQLKANDRVAIATFSSRVDLIENFTTDRARTEKTLERIWARGGTAFYDALMTCISEYMRDVEGRGAVVVFTDGIDNQLEGGYPSPSQTTFDELYKGVQAAGSTIYPIFLDAEGGDAGGPTMATDGRSRQPYPDRRRTPTLNPPTSSPELQKRQAELTPYELAVKQLQMIADQTGGRMYRPRRIEELSRIYSEIARDLRVQYQLGYNPSNQAHDGRWREIRVEVKDHPEAVVRTRKGYFARKSTGG